MTAPTKDKLITISASVIGSILLMFLGLFSTGMIDSRKDLQIQVKNKVDKEIFDQHAIDNRLRFDDLEQNQRDYMKNNNEILQELVKQNAEIKTDIKWLINNRK